MLQTYCYETFYTSELKKKIELTEIVLIKKKKSFIIDYN